MDNEFLYMLGVVAIGCGITLAMRAIPFLLFAGRTRELPAWVTRFGSFISPVIIAALIVYSYWGLKVGAGTDHEVRACLTPWPYVAGAVTVVLHLLLRNPLVSIITGTVVFMSLLGMTGCASVPVETVRSTVAHPLIHVTRNGIYYREKPVLPENVGKLLERDKVSKTAALHVLVDPDFNDQHAIWVFKHNYLDRAGYTRSIMMNGAQHGVSGTSELRESFESKGKVIPYEKRFQQKGGSSWR